MDPSTIISLVGLAQGTIGSTLGPVLDYFGNPARTYKRRELREIMKLRESLKRTYLGDPLAQSYMGSLQQFATHGPFGPSQMALLERQIRSGSMAESLAGRRLVEQNLSAMGLTPGAQASAIQQEMDRVRGLLASMARTQAGSYAAAQNVQQLEQSRQALAGALTDRYSTLATILGAGV